MDEPAALYFGSVMHARMKPVAHRFTYRVASLLIDIDRLAEADRLTPLFSTTRPAPLSFRERDHAREGGGLRERVDALLAQAGLPRPAQVSLLCYPRVFGFVFNPLSIYYCRDGAGALCALIYEVRNTFGQMHAYVAPIVADEASAAGVRQERDKLFHVSPFLDMAMRYRFRLTPPGARIAVRILEVDAQGPVLAAAFQGERRVLSTRSALRLLTRLPFLTLKIVVAIHWEALRLWRKGLRLRAVPAPPPAFSIAGHFTPPPLEKEPA